MSVVQCGYRKVWPDRDAAIHACASQTIGAENSFECYLLGKGLTSIVCDKLYERKLFEQGTSPLRFPKGQTMEDAFILTDLFARNRIAVRTIPDIFYNYRMRAGSIMNRRLDLKFMRSSLLQYAHRVEVTEKDFPDLYPIALRQLSSDLLQYYRLIYLGRAVDPEGGARIMYRELAAWQDRYNARFPFGKTKMLLRLLRRFPGAIRLLLR